MDAKLLAAELLEGFLSAFRAGPVEWTSVDVANLLMACANNAATGLAPRTVPNDVADALAEAGYTLHDAVAEGMFVLAEELQAKAGK